MKTLNITASLFSILAGILLVSCASDKPTTTTQTTTTRSTTVAQPNAAPNIAAPTHNGY